jgi:hypothetical protein
MHIHIRIHMFLSGNNELRIFYHVIRSCKYTTQKRTHIVKEIFVDEVFIGRQAEEYY